MVWSVGIYSSEKSCIGTAVEVLASCAGEQTRTLIPTLTADDIICTRGAIHDNVYLGQ